MKDIELKELRDLRRQVSRLNDDLEHSKIINILLSVLIGANLIASIVQIGRW